MNQCADCNSEMVDNFCDYCEYLADEEYGELSYEDMIIPNVCTCCNSQLLFDFHICNRCIDIHRGVWDIPGFEQVTIIAEDDIVFDIFVLSTHEFGKIAKIIFEEGIVTLVDTMPLYKIHLFIDEQWQPVYTAHESSMTHAQYDSYLLQYIDNH